MKKANLLLMIPFLMAAVIGLSSCSDDDDNNTPTPATGKEVTINVASSWKTWNYFSFEAGEVIGTGNADAESDAEWKIRTDWDIAFTRLYARTNSGTSGIGLGGVIEISPDNTDKASVFANLLVAPTAGYNVDVTEEVMYAMPPEYYDAGCSPTINSWLTVSMPVGVSPKVLVVKTASGKYAKVYLKGYQNDEGATGYIKMEYVYQADGSTNLATE